MEFYRYIVKVTGSKSEDSHQHISLVFEVYNLHKETPKGYWIGFGIKEDNEKLRGKSIWVSKTAKKRFAYKTKIEALQSLISIKKAQIRILTSNTTIAILSKGIAEKELLKMQM